MIVDQLPIVYLPCLYDCADPAFCAARQCEDAMLHSLSSQPDDYDCLISFQRFFRPLPTSSIEYLEEYVFFRLQFSIETKCLKTDLVFSLGHRICLQSCSIRASSSLHWRDSEKRRQEASGDHAWRCRDDGNAWSISQGPSCASDLDTDEVKWRPQQYLFE
jgi:hypothetical protein